MGEVCKSRRQPRVPGDLRALRMPFRRSSPGPHQHDDSRSHALGRCVVQQRRISVKESALRRELLAGWQAAAADHLAPTDSRRDEAEGSPPVHRSAAALGDLPAWECAASVRARWTGKGRDWESCFGRGSRTSRREAVHAGIWHRAAHRSSFPWIAKNPAA